MADSKPANPNVVTYADHEVITPDTRKLRRTLRPARPDDDDPVARAEMALAQMASEFTTWMNDECTRLDAARQHIKKIGMNKQNRQELFLAAHDVKGDCETFGYGEVAPAADSLCRLLDHTPEHAKIPFTLIDQHVDAVRAIVREHTREDMRGVATALCSRLRQVTEEFLADANRDRPDYLKTIASPSVASAEF